MTATKRNPGAYLHHVFKTSMTPFSVVASALESFPLFDVLATAVTQMEFRQDCELISQSD